MGVFTVSSSLLRSLPLLKTNTMDSKTQGFQLRFIADDLLVAFPTLHPSQAED